MYCQVLIVFLVLVATALAAVHTLCLPCRESECTTPPESCPHGVTRNSCGRVVCAAGPGERCGGRENHLGKCGDGMTCKCGKCRGCSITRLMTGIIECEYKSPSCK